MFTLNGIAIDNSSYVYTAPAAREVYTQPAARLVYTGPAAREVYTGPAAREVWTGPPGQVFVEGAGRLLVTPPTQEFQTTGGGQLFVDRTTNPDFIERAGGAIVRGSV